ncbi:unnamed protein product [Allacma fusca]|uniref:Uncharacterized protein n=1 Tax=Allacma fusca TaxID=39272 RepID=A0A8J2NSS9_9HEXA|nr:unnamed protein product [Allacma fusca]
MKNRKRKLSHYGWSDRHLRLTMRPSHPPICPENSTLEFLPGCQAILLPWFNLNFFDILVIKILIIKKMLAESSTLIRTYCCYNEICPQMRPA